MFRFTKLSYHILSLSLYSATTIPIHGFGGRLSHVYGGGGGGRNGAPENVVWA